MAGYNYIVYHHDATTACLLISSDVQNMSWRPVLSTEGHVSRPVSTEEEKKRFQIPDLVIRDLDDGFTQVPNWLLRTPLLSAREKGVAALLLSNREGWHSFTITIASMMRDSVNAIRSMLVGLEQHNLLYRIPYRDKKTKTFRGTFLFFRCPPGPFDDVVLQAVVAHMDARECEALPGTIESLKTTTLPFTECGNSALGKAACGKAACGKSPANNINQITPTERTTKIRRRTLCPRLDGVDSVRSDTSTSQDEHPVGKQTPKERAKQYLPVAQTLADIILQYRKIKTDPRRLLSWAIEIRKLVEVEGVTIDRVEKVLDWYRNNAGGQYVPIVESGHSLRDKLPRLEAAMERAQGVDRPTVKVSVEDIEARLAGTGVPELYDKAFIPARRLIKEGSDSDLSAQILAMHTEMFKIRRRVPEEQLHRINGISSLELLHDYIEWLGRQSWIERLDTSLFNTKHKIFRSYLAEQAKNNNDFNPLTGADTSARGE